MSILILHKKNLSRRRHLARTQRYAQEHGERVLLVMKDPTWEGDYADRVIKADTASIPDTLAAVKEATVDEPEPITAVVTFIDSGVPTAAALANALGLPSISDRTAYLARDKFAMRTAFAQAGDIPQPRFGVAHTLAEAKELAGYVGYPLVLKPFIGSGSMYVRSIADERELTEHFEEIRAGAWDGFEFDPLHADAVHEYAGGLLMEEFVPGAEISVESLIVHGRTHSIAIHDKPLPTGPTFEEVYACTPTRLPEDVVAALYAVTESVHRAMGITTGASHVEFRLRGDREPVILEAAARMGGGPIYRSVQLSTGVDMVAALLDIASGREPVIEPDPNPNAAGFWNIFPQRPGNLTEVAGLAQAQADPRVDEVDIYKRLGEFLDVPPRTFQSHGHLIFTAPRQQDLDESFHELTELVQLRTDWRS